MLATHTMDPEDPASSTGQAPVSSTGQVLYTITAGGFSATADAFARDEETDGLWFVSMVGSQTALKAIWASLLKQPPDVAHIIEGADGMALSGAYKRCVVPHETIGTWTTKIARLPVSGGWHALVYTKTAEYGFERDSFLLLAQTEEEAPRAAPPLPRQEKPAAPAQLLGGVALATGTGHGGDSPPPVGGHHGLQVQPRRRESEGCPLPGGGGGRAVDAGGGGSWWIGC